MRKNSHIRLLLTCVLIGLAMEHRSSAQTADITQLSQHFNVPGADISPWKFGPQANVRQISTENHPGMIEILEAGKGMDIKGLLQRPIRMDDYPLPWEFQTALVQNFDAQAGVGSKTQVNYAIGMNIAVTFSDPKTWPKDRSQRPPDTREYQLLVVHLGTTGEAGAGLPQYSEMPHPETYKVWGRGDLGHLAMGDWDIPHIWVGDGSRRAGPASDQLFFRCRVLNPTTIQAGIRFDQTHGFHMRYLDVTKYGPITGIWEIGPVFSCDRWIPDVLCRNLKMEKGWHPELKHNPEMPNGHEWFNVFSTPVPEPPDPQYEYYVDYCVFLPTDPKPLEALSTEFDTLGYLGDVQAQPQGTLIETYSKPGHLTMTLTGTGSGTGFSPVGGALADLSVYRPPWEMETAFIAPDDSIPWNWFMNLGVWEQSKQERKGMWQPGVQYFPDSKRHRFINRVVRSEAALEQPATSIFDVSFKEEPPAEVMSSRPLYMLIQIIDDSHVRVGFRSDPDMKWYLSEILDVSDALDGPIGQFDQFAWSTVTGHRWGAPLGGPMYQRFHIDYVRYRYGLSTDDPGKRSRAGDR